MKEVGVGQEAVSDEEILERVRAQGKVVKAEIRQ